MSWLSPSSAFDGNHDTQPGASKNLFTRMTQLDPDCWTSQILASFVGSIALSPLMLLPVLVYAYDSFLGYGPDVAGWISSAALMGLAAATLLVSFRTTHWSMGRVSALGMLIML